MGWGRDGGNATYSYILPGSRQTTSPTLFQTDFDEREHFVLSSLYRNIAFIVICELRIRHSGPTRASILFSSHWNLCSKRPPRLAMHPFRRFVKVCMALVPGAGRYGPSRQQSLRRSFRLSISCIFTAHQLLQLSPYKELCDLSMDSSEVKLPAWVIAGRRGPGSPGSADSDRKAANRTSGASVDGIWCDCS